MAMSIANMSQSMLVSLVVLLNSADFKAKFYSEELSVKSFVKWIGTAAVSDVKEIIESMKFNALQRMSSLKISQFLKSENMALRRFGAQQHRQALRASLAFHTYSMKQNRIRKLVLHFFHERKFPVSMLNKVQFLQWFHDIIQENAQTPYEMSLPIAFETQLYFHYMAFVSRESVRKKAEDRSKCSE